MKTVVISGGSSGIGLATANKFSEANFTVYSLDINPPCSQDNKNIIYINCDITKVNNIQNAAKEINKSTSIIDALICNAGIHFSSTIEATTENDFDNVVAINLKGCFFLTQTFLPFMKKQKSGSIVFVGSDQTLIGKKNSAIYGATKAALGSLAKTTALDYAEYGIRSNLVAAGTIDTPLYQKAVKNYCIKSGANIDTVHTEEAKEQPLNRIGFPNEVANFIYFLCSDKASFMTGGIYPIDGGYTAR